MYQQLVWDVWIDRDSRNSFCCLGYSLEVSSIFDFFRCWGLARAFVDMLMVSLYEYVLARTALSQQESQLKTSRYKREWKRAF